ncbi:Acetyl-coenzyme A carboxylase carboxyl transferase subunit alpha [Raoultella terrigena]|uniref:Acetyl-coenzyme A carboxylase carboxyl transferase subunit alpha n=1 Tax=Raoultella terrigena TaxID=577 RepID=A0A4U9D960_RAOTE|nr:Acetyl-coenzyme A carboxylase carboxyl transferase subunit alpha [Raoultella terrigena]
MSLNFLDFEQPIAELEAKIDSLTAVSRQDEKLDINIDEEVHRLREKSVELTRKIFADLGAWQGCSAGTPSTSPIHPGLCPPGVRRV